MFINSKILTAFLKVHVKYINLNIFISKTMTIVHGRSKQKLPLVWVSEVAQSCPTLCDPIDCSLPGSSVHGIFQARVLEWVAWPLINTEGLSCDLSTLMKIIIIIFLIGSVRTFLFNLFIYWPCQTAPKILVPRPAIEPTHPAVEA